MLRIDGSHLMAVLNLIDLTVSLAETEPDTVYGSVDSRQALSTQIGMLIAALQTLRLSMSVKRAQTLQSRLSLYSDDSNKTVALATLVTSDWRDIRERMKDELMDCSLYFLELPKAQLYEDRHTWFGVNTNTVFHEAKSDLAEAAACLAFGRATACVFHLMRAMELALRVLGSKLNVTVQDRNGTLLAWGPLLANVDQAIKDLPTADERERWSEAAILLFHVKQRWRNDTMHPKATYEEEEARRVFDAVKSFLDGFAGLVQCEDA